MSLISHISLLISNLLLGARFFYGTKELFEFGTFCHPIFNYIFSSYMASHNSGTCPWQVLPYYKVLDFSSNMYNGEWSIVF